jgi:hypothetical protein
MILCADWYERRSVKARHHVQIGFAHKKVTKRSHFIFCFQRAAFFSLHDANEFWTPETGVPKGRRCFMNGRSLENEYRNI